MSLLDLRLVKHSDLVMIPSCLDCNNILGRCRFHQPTKRRDVVKKKLKQRLKGKERCDWTEKEIRQLGPNLAREVRAHQRTVDDNRERLTFKTRIYSDDY